MNERRILGIDPGFGRLGYAVILAKGNDLDLLVCDAVMTPKTLAMLLLEQRGVSIAEYTPSEVKLAVTGYGAARKEQIGYMVRHLLHLPAVPRPDDAADAAAIAICHAHILRPNMAKALK